MELSYSFDPAKWRLGKLCPHGHEWPGTGQSLRRAESGVYGCAGCTGRKQSDWLLSFVDYSSMGWPESQRLGILCSNQHRWNNSDLTLRVNGRCVDCDKAAAPDKRQAAKAKAKINPELKVLRKKQNRQTYISAKERFATDPNYAEHRRAWRRNHKQKIRQQLREQGLTDKGKAPVRVDGAVPKGEVNKAIELERTLQKALQRALRPGRHSPSVAQLVMQAQRLYWQEDPEARRQHANKWRQANWWLQYQINLDLRLYNREKKHRRKAKERGQTPLQVPVAALRQRFNEFSNCCAYCGQEGDMQMEHVEPIDKGGLHDIGNIVPACLSCNYSKRTSEMESWYRRQPFFSELRLARIRRVVRRPEGAQLAFALA